MGGLGSLGGLKNHDETDEKLFNAMDLQSLMQQAEAERKRGYNITYTRDTRSNAEELQVDEYQRKMDEMLADRKRLLGLDPSEFIIRPSAMAQALSDPSLFDNSVMHY